MHPSPFPRGPTPLIPASSQSVPPPSFSYQQTKLTGGVPPPPSGATPFIPRGNTAFSAPPTSSLPPPPPSDVQSPLPQESSKFSSHALGSHPRQGITAAQLYSLNVIGSGTFSRPSDIKKSQFRVLRDLRGHRMVRTQLLNTRQNILRIIPNPPKKQRWALVSLFIIASETFESERCDQSESHSSSGGGRSSPNLHLGERRRLD